jgi:L-aminopeptidase/D-esterase-like protein
MVCGSGDIFISFSTANENAFNRDNMSTVNTLPNDQLSPFFDATTHAVEESIINAMIAAETMEGINGNKAYALPHNLLIKVLKKYQRIN